MTGENVVIVGGGQAGCQAAISLRQAGFQGSITLFGEEPALPYQRPPLSKAYLKGELDEERLYFRPADFFEAQSIDVRTDARVDSIDRGKQRLRVEGAGDVAYDKLLLATGAPPRRLRLSGAELGGVHYLRTLTDSRHLRSILTADGRVVILGAGYIGLEVAAVARAAGRDVTVLEMADRVLKRVVAPELSAFYQGLHGHHGVDVRLGAAVEAMLGADGRVSGVQLSSGEVIDCSSVLVGIGAVPCTELALEAGLECDNGILVDEHARTSDPNIYAAGDCSNFPSPRYGRRMRLESVPNAIEQAKVAGANMAGAEQVHDALPWFWSDQYNIKLQIAGFNKGYERVVLRGEPSSDSFVAWYMKGNTVLAADCINSSKEFMQAKKLIAQKVEVTDEQLANTEIAVADLVPKPA